jgi:hypothetical protein
MPFAKGTLILTFSLGENELPLVPANGFTQLRRLRLHLPEGEGWGEGQAFKPIANTQAFP